MRALLIVSVLDEAALSTALRAGADALILDLEGCTHPGPPALQAMARARAATPATLLHVRVGGLTAGQTDRDLDAVMPARPDGILLPGTTGGADVAQLGAKLAVREAELGWPDGCTAILGLVTTAAGVLGLGALQAAGPRLRGLAWDGRALAADLLGERTGQERGTPTRPLGLVRNLVLLAATAAGIAAIDEPFCPADAPERLETACAAAAQDGFRAKLALCAAQVPVIQGTV